MTPFEFRSDADHNYAERLANSQHVDHVYTLREITDAIGYVDQTGQISIMVNPQLYGLVNELTDDIAFGIGCAIENTIEARCRKQHQAKEEDLLDGRVSWNFGLNGNDEECFTITGEQSVRVYGEVQHFHYTIEELRFIDWDDDSFIQWVIDQINQAVDNQLRSKVA